MKFNCYYILNNKLEYTNNYQNYITISSLSKAVTVKARKHKSIKEFKAIEKDLLSKNL